MSVGHFPPTASFFLFVEGFPTLWRITYRLLNIIFLRRRSCQTRRSRANETLIIIFFSLFYTRFSFLFSPHEPVLFYAFSYPFSPFTPLSAFPETAPVVQTTVPYAYELNLRVLRRCNAVNFQIVVNQRVLRILNIYIIIFCTPGVMSRS